MLDAPTDRTRLTTAVPLRAKQHDAGIGHERRSAAEPFLLWSNVSSVINILLLKAKVKHRVASSPTPHYPLKFEITFCVRGVISPLMANIYLHVLDTYWTERYSQLGTLCRYADDFVIVCRSKKEAERALEMVRWIMGKLKLTLHPTKTHLVDLGRE